MSEEVRRAAGPAVLPPVPVPFPVRAAGGGALSRLVPARAEPPLAPRAPDPTAAQLSGFLAHELASPMGVLGGALYLLSQERLEGRAAELAGRASEAARDLADAVDDLRALAGVVPGSVVSAAEAAAEAVDGVARGAGVRVLVDAPHPCDGPRVHGHRGLLRRAVRNLVQNAAEAVAGDGTVGIVVRGAGDRVRITVWDDGPGIAPEHRAQVFARPFTTRPGGSGLGLLLVRAVVEGVHGGSVTLHPRQPRGSIFRIDLPRAPSGPVPG